MVQTYSDNKYIYSVDMMFAYIYFNKIKITKYKIDQNILKNLDYEGWGKMPNILGDPLKNIKFSPNAVLANPRKYRKDYDRIKNANLKYPIIMDQDDNIIDGVHRLSKAVLLNKKYINAYIFDKKLMKKFIVAKRDQWDKVNEIKIYQYIILYIERLKKF